MISMDHQIFRNTSSAFSGYNARPKTSPASQPASMGAEGESMVKCELVDFSLAERPLLGYVAVSYRWGTDEQVSSIEISEHVFMVRDNLYNFLLQMASEKSRGWFFVDAICINQNDGSEKAAQVNMMGEVYKDARRVLVWMGREEPGEDDDEEA